MKNDVTATCEEGEGRLKIIAAAEKLFADHGFDAVSMHAIATAAGISKANIYHYFSNKDALYLAVLQGASAALRARLQEAMDSRGPASEALRHFAVSHLRHLLARPYLVRLFLRELLENGEPRARDLADAGLADLFASLVGILRMGQEQGELRSDFDPALVATMLLGANVIFFQLRDLLRQYPEVHFVDTPEEYDLAMVEVLLQGIRQNPQDSSS
ncbi:TetR/AcrR family transcriptional regulator [Candidatus Igneacidithiobacillus taiwanensis]|uniref:TetR/AcrR family transcriptional regulator n=1 Tax=Candidatus Igneacidithiobacillus taiwanensis TaxID=1945924 RepID=UPI00289813E3|nr:TetR/AcrR family transcriptional regulator [Candidatus Igneacidithiobacillus taiwanensis]